MINNAWSKSDAQSYEIEQHKKMTCKFLDELLSKRKEQQALHYELHKNIALQRRIALRQAEKIEDEKAKVTALEKKLEESQGATSELAAIRSAKKDLESKLEEAKKKQKLSDDKLLVKSSELERAKSDHLAKRAIDMDIIEKLQKEVKSLRSYMSQDEAGWDLLNSDVFDPLGYNEERRELFPREDLIKLARDDCKHLISASRKICHNLAMKDSRKCDVRGLIEKMALLPELVTDLQASSARGAAQMALAMCLAWDPSIDLDKVTTAIPTGVDADKILDACSGYDTRIARRIRHEEFYDKTVLPSDEHLEAEMLKEAESKKKPASFGNSSGFTWTSSKEKDDDDASSPACDAEK